MTGNTSYFVFFPVRDGENGIVKTMDSLLCQSLPPAKIIVTEDGSTDNTAVILSKYEQQHPSIVHVIHTGSKTRDYRRIPSLWNMAIEYAASQGLTQSCGYHLIGAGDIALEPKYAESIILHMEANPRLVICSGDYGSRKSQAPHGAGRVIRQSFFNDHYGKKYNAIVGYESEILHRAILRGFKIGILNDVTFEHLDKLGGSHNFKEFGYAMRALGYSKLYVIARFLNDYFTNREMGRKGAVNMLVSYLKYPSEVEGYYSYFDRELQAMISRNQMKQLKHIPMALAVKTLKKVHVL